LALAADDCLDASAGFRVLPGGETWEGRSRRRIVKAWLDHIALTPDPAYTDARVLAVRNGATPRIDAICEWQRENRLAPALR
jgi:phage head maturation protease